VVFFSRIRDLNGPIRPATRISAALALFGSLGVVLFSVCVAKFPGEWANDRLPNMRVIPAKWFPRQWTKGRWTSLHDLLFAGVVDEINGKPTSLFSNRLVVTGQSFVDVDKLDKVNVSLSFRGRDLRSAVFFGADLRKADFTGALLDDADFTYAKLQHARFQCAENWKQCTSLREARMSAAQLQNANFSGARMSGATLYKSKLQGSNLQDADLRAAGLEHANLAGAYMEETDLRCAHLDSAELQGADLHDAELEGAWLENANFQGAKLNNAELQGANLAGTDLRGASLRGAEAWHVRGWAVLKGGATVPMLEFAQLDDMDFDKKPWGKSSTFASWHEELVKDLAKDSICYGTSFVTLDPAAAGTSEIIEQVFRQATQSSSRQSDQHKQRYAEFSESRLFDRITAVCRARLNQQRSFASRGRSYASHCGQVA
jgi:uncharacterized protein YjbI with pentapeptide repeats